MVNKSPDPSSISRTEQNLNDPSLQRKLSFNELSTQDLNERNSLSSNSPAPDTVQHFAETYIAATKIWCAAAVRLAQHLNKSDAQTRSKRSSQKHINAASLRFLESQQLVLEEVRQLCQEFRAEVAKGGSNTPTDISRCEQCMH